MSIDVLNLLDTIEELVVSIDVPDGFHTRKILLI